MCVLQVEDGVNQLEPTGKTHGVFPLKLKEAQSESTINITLGPQHFNAKGEAKISCVASISTLFWQGGDERVLGNSRQVPNGIHRHNNNHAVSSQIFQDNREALLLGKLLTHIQILNNLINTREFFTSFQFAGKAWLLRCPTFLQ